MSLLGDEPVSYSGEIVDAELTTALNILRRSPQKPISIALGMSERRWRDIVQGKARPHKKLRARIFRLAALVAVDPTIL